MKAAVFAAIGKLELQDVPEPQISNSNEVKVRPLAGGICGTDLHILSDPPGHPGTVGAILGHEFVAEVAQIGADVKNVKVGQRVAVRPIVTCGACRYCLLGSPNHCTNMVVHGVFHNGGFAEYAVLPDTALMPISEKLPLHIAALTEPLACVLNAVQKISLSPGETAVVLGAGAIGLMYLALFKAAGASQVIIVEPSKWRAEVALKMGATSVIDPTAVNTIDEINKLVPGGAHVAVDAVGSQLQVALQVVGRKGRIVLFGINTHAEVPIKQHFITEKEVTIFGSFVGQQTFPDAIRLLESGVIDFSPIVSHTYGLDDLPSSLDEIRGGTVVKAVVTV